MKKDNSHDYFFNIIKEEYLKKNPLPDSLIKEIEKNHANSSKRIDDINTIRLNNIETTFWSNTGAVVGIIVTIASFIFGLLYGSISFLGSNNLNVSIKIILLVLCFYLLYRFVKYSIPILLKRIIYHLPPDEYAKNSLSNLSKSGVLTFTAYKMWEICNLFIEEIKIDKELIDLSEISDKSIFDKKYDNEIEKKKKSIKKLLDSVIKLNGIYYDYYYNVIAVRDLSVDKLKIQEREFCHHILKFSPAILDSRLHTLNLSAETIEYCLSINSRTDESVKEVFHNHLKEIIRIYKDVEANAMRSLLQIILYEEIHDCLIGISSVTSTSRSLKIFLRGLSSVIYKWIKIKESNSSEEKNISFRQAEFEFKSILHRSKAHYGMDLLISLENLYRKKYPNKQIPDVLYHILYRIDRNPEALVKRLKTTFDDNISFSTIISNNQDDLKDMREDLFKSYKEDSIKIKQSFNDNLSKLLSKSGEKYLCVFGYSRVVRNILKACATELEENNINVFIFKQECYGMIDTRIMRYELNDEKYTSNIRRTFTSSDRFLKSLIRKEDSVVLIAGAESYCPSSKLLLHTNNYQSRIENFIDTMQNSEDKPNPDIWIVAHDYKIFESFPPEKYLFKNEFLSDHYDEVDLYNFSNLIGEINVITN